MNMADFDIVGQLKLLPPANLKSIANAISKSLSGLNGNIGIKIAPGLDGELNKVRGSLGKLESGFASAASQGKNLGAVLDDLAKSVRGFSKAASANNNSAKKIKGISDAAAGASTELSLFEKRVKSTALSFAAYVGIAQIFNRIADAVGVAVRESINYQDELVKLKQVGGDSATSIKSVSDEVVRLSTSLGLNSSNLIKVASTLRQAGLSAEETKKSLGGLAKASLAPSFTDFNNATEGLIALKGQFSIQAKDFEKALGSINAVSNRFAVESNDLVTAIRTAGASFKQSGGELEEFLGLFTSIRQATREDPESIATGLKTIFSNLQKSDTIDKIKELGISLRDTEGNFVGAYRAFGLLSAGLEKLGDKSQQYFDIVEKIGGVRQIGKIIPGLKNFATAQEAVNIAKRGTNSLDLASIQAQEKLEVKLIKVKEQFEEIFKIIINSKPIQQFADLVLNLATGLNILAKSLQGVLPGLLLLGGLKLGLGVAGVGTNIYNNITKRAHGGSIPGSGNADNIPILATPGEFVIKKDSATKLGRRKLDYLNDHGDIPHFAEGGEVSKKDREKQRIKRIKERQSSVVDQKNYEELQILAKKEKRQEYIDGVKNFFTTNVNKVGNYTSNKIQDVKSFIDNDNRLDIISGFTREKINDVKDIGNNIKSKIPGFIGERVSDVKDIGDNIKSRILKPGKIDLFKKNYVDKESGKPYSKDFVRNIVDAKTPGTARYNKFNKPLDDIDKNQLSGVNLNPNSVFYKLKNAGVNFPVDPSKYINGIQELPLDGAKGSFSRKSKVIKIDSGLRGNERLPILAHEAAHAFDFRNNSKPTDTPESSKKGTIEKKITDANFSSYPQEKYDRYKTKYEDRYDKTVGIPSNKKEFKAKQRSVNESLRGEIFANAIENYAGNNISGNSGANKTKTGKLVGKLFDRKNSEIEKNEELTLLNRAFQEEVILLSKGKSTEEAYYKAKQRVTKELEHRASQKDVPLSKPLVRSTPGEILNLKRIKDEAIAASLSKESTSTNTFGMSDFDKSKYAGKNKTKSNDTIVDKQDKDCVCDDNSTGSRSKKSRRSKNGPSGPNGPNGPGDNGQYIDSAVPTVGKNPGSKFSKIATTAGALATVFGPSLAETFTGTAEKPGVFGTGGAKAGKVVGSIISSVGQGAVAAGAIGGPTGLVVGGLIGLVGAIIGAKKAASEFDEELAKINQSKSIENFDKSIEKFLVSKGDFGSKENVDFTDLIANTKKSQDLQIKNNILSKNVTGGGTYLERLSDPIGPFKEAGKDTVNFGKYILQSLLERHTSDKGGIVDKGFYDSLSPGQSENQNAINNSTITKYGNIDNTKLKEIITEGQPVAERSHAVFDQLLKTDKVGNFDKFTNSKVGKNIIEGITAGSADPTDSSGVSSRAAKAGLKKQFEEAQAAKTITNTVQVLNLQFSKAASFISRFTDAVEHSTDDLNKSFSNLSFSNSALTGQGGSGNVKFGANVLGNNGQEINAFAGRGGFIEHAKNQLPDTVEQLIRDSEANPTRSVTQTKSARQGILIKSGINGPIGQNILANIDDHEKFSNIKKQAKNGEFDKITDELLGSFNHYNDKFSKITANLEKAGSDLTQGLDIIASNLSRIDAELDQNNGIQVGNLRQKARIDTENAQTNFGNVGFSNKLPVVTASQLFGGKGRGFGLDTSREQTDIDRISLQDLNAPFVEKQKRLTGFNTQDAFDPQKIGAKLRSDQDSLTNAQARVAANQNSPEAGAAEATIQAASEVTKFSKSVADGIKALENLKDTAASTAAAQEKLARVNQQIEGDAKSRLGSAESFLNATPQERRETLKNQNFAQAAINNGSFQGFGDKQIKGALAGLNQLGETRIQTGVDARGNATFDSAQNVKNTLIKNSGGGLQDSRDPAFRQRNALNGEISKAGSAAEQASNVLINNLTDSNNKFLQGLESIFKTYFGKGVGESPLSGLARGITSEMDPTARLPETPPNNPENIIQKRRRGPVNFTGASIGNDRSNLRNAALNGVSSGIIDNTVVPRRERGLPNLQKGKISERRGFSTPDIPVDATKQASNFSNPTLNTFASSANALADALKTTSIPSEISANVNSVVDVRLNGAELLASLGPQVEKIINERISARFAELSGKEVGV
jgi:TP901 family phage tail tape measure protein